jgi:hypothetical protein
MAILVPTDGKIRVGNMARRRAMENKRPCSMPMDLIWEK